MFLMHGFSYNIHACRNGASGGGFRAINLRLCPALLGRLEPLGSIIWLPVS
jgi:hypothetical protein